MLPKLLCMLVCSDATRWLRSMITCFVSFLLLSSIPSGSGDGRYHRKYKLGMSMCLIPAAGNMCLRKGFGLMTFWPI